MRSLSLSQRLPITSSSLPNPRKGSLRTVFDYTDICWGEHYYRIGRIDKAQQKFETTLAYFTEIQDEVGMGKSLNGLSALYLDQGHYARSLACSQAAVEILRETHASADYTLAVYQLGRSYFELNHIADAERHLESALALYHDQDDREGEDRALLHLGRAYAAQERYLFALACYEAVLDSIVTASIPEERADLLQKVMDAMMQLCQQTKAEETAIASFQSVLEKGRFADDSQYVAHLIDLSGQYQQG